MFRRSENPAGSGDAHGASGAEFVAEVSREFSPEQRKTLLSIARAAIASGMRGEALPETQQAGSLPTSAGMSASETATAAPGSWLLEPRGVFTTLYIGEQLRGCVGYPAPIRPLHQALAETARAAAFDDSRFRPVRPEEVRELRISVSVLSPLFPIRPEQVEIGRHGLVISDGARRGLLLPQVPVEYGWDRETFLAQTCHKAGLATDAWRGSATIQAFTAEVFGDDDSVVA